MPTSTPTTARTRRPRAEREQIVLDTAARLYYSRGVHEVGMDELVAASGLGKATVYRLFPTKDALIEAYLTRLSATIASAIADRIAQTRDPRTGLHAILDDIERDVRGDDFRGCAFNNASIEFTDPGHPARARAREHRALLLTELTQLAEALSPGRGPALGGQLAVLIDGAYTSAAHLGPDGPAAAGLALAHQLVTDA
jgi:AcrR family transcriptional regulator